MSWSDVFLLGLCPFTHQVDLHDTHTFNHLANTFMVQKGVFKSKLKKTKQLPHSCECLLSLSSCRWSGRLNRSGHRATTSLWVWGIHKRCPLHSTTHFLFWSFIVNGPLNAEKNNVILGGWSTEYILQLHICVFLSVKHWLSSHKNDSYVYCSMWLILLSLHSISRPAVAVQNRWDFPKARGEALVPAVPGPPYHAHRHLGQRLAASHRIHCHRAEGRRCSQVDSSGTGICSDHNNAAIQQAQ